MSFWLRFACAFLMLKTSDRLGATLATVLLSVVYFDIEQCCRVEPTYEIKSVAIVKFSKNSIRRKGLRLQYKLD